MDQLNVTVGEEVLMDIRSGVTPYTYQLKVVAVTQRRFVAEGSINGRCVRKTFLKADGRSVGGRYFNWARKA